MQEVGAHLADVRAIHIHLADCRESYMSTCPAPLVSTFMVSYSIFHHVYTIIEYYKKYFTIISLVSIVEILLWVQFNVLKIATQ